jgi:hypothetical protein
VGDYSRLRPLSGDPLQAIWRTFSRFEKCCWYWSEFNRILLAHAKELPEYAYRFIFIDRDNAI